MINPSVHLRWPTIPWRLTIPPKVKLFLWLLLQDKLLTNENLVKRNWPGGSKCMLCDVTLLETSCHLFFSCSYSQRVWADIMPNNHQVPDQIEVIPTILNTTRMTNNLITQQYAAVCWNIWKERNRHIFQDKKMTANTLTTRVLLDLELWRTLQRPTHLSL
jgi:zinc-binding in reverse transcriptase